MLDLFSPLSKESCIYFYIMGMISLIAMFISIILFVYNLFKGGKFKDLLSANFFIIITNSLLMYFVNRLFYSMCIKTL